MKNDRIHALVVDNSPVIRRLLEYVLEAEGCSVRSAENGLEALDRMAEQRPDILFTDLIMPEIDGEKLSYIVRNTHELKDVFLVILSGVALEDDSIIRRIKADACIAKGPPTAMKAHIRAALARYRANQRGEEIMRGMEGLYPREVTSELLLSKRHREVVLARMSEGVVELNHEGRVIMANDAAIALFGEPEARILGRHLATLVPQPAGDRIVAWMEQIGPQAGGLEPLSFPYDDPVRMGDRQVTYNLVPVMEETTFFIIGILQDVTRRKRMEQRQHQLEKELQRVRKLEAMAVMASGISHDFNNLMTIVSGNVEMAHYVSRDENVQHLLNEASKAIGLTTQLIRQFTTFSDNYLPQKSQVRLCDLIGSVLEQDLADTGIEFQVACNNEDMAIPIDPILVSQVFNNLTSNSVAAMNGTGRIEVAIDRVDGNEEATATSHPVPAGELVRIVFADTGPGVDPAMLDQVFDPYFSTKQKGTQKGMGLGLTIAHAIIKKHGGAIWIETPPGGGCAVRMYLPSQTAAVDDARYHSRKGAGKRILVMDGEEVMRLIDQRMFEQFGCSVTLAGSGAEAVELYRRQMAGGGRFDLTLLDLSADGDPAKSASAREIMAMDPKAALVAVCDSATGEVIRRSGVRHFAAAVPRPLSIDAVKELVDRFL